MSDDGRWWWDGHQWQPAMSSDGQWRWTGAEWVPTAARPQQAATGVVTSALRRGTGRTLGVLVGLAVIATVAVMFIARTQSDSVTAFIKYEGVVGIVLAATAGKLSGWRLAVAALGFLVVGLAIAFVVPILFG